MLCPYNCGEPRPAAIPSFASKPAVTRVRPRYRIATSELLVAIRTIRE